MVMSLVVVSTTHDIIRDFNNAWSVIKINKINFGYKVLCIEDSDFTDL